jgi:hypothetical protein
MRGWVDFGAVKQTVSLEAVLRHYQVPGLRKRRFTGASATIPFAPV